VSVLFSIAVAAVLLVVAPIVAHAMREPALTSVLRVLSIGLAVQGTLVVSGALMRRQLDFRRQALIETVSSLIGLGGVAVTLAFLGYGVWSLVYGGLVSGVFMSGAQMVVVRHSVRPLLGRRELRDLMHLGVGSTLNNLLSYIAVNGDNLLVGRLMGATSLGLYSRAYNLMSVPHSYTSTVIAPVLFPAFAQIHTESDRLRRAYLIITELMAVVAAPLMVGMAVAAPHLVAALYGPQWIGTTVPFQILCIAGYFRTLSPLGGVVAQSTARIYRAFWLQVGYVALVIGGVWIGSNFGLPGVSMAVGGAIVCMFVGVTRLALNIVGASWREFFLAQRLACATGVITLVIAFGMRLTLEFWEASGLVITIAIAASCSVPWTIGILWKLGEPEFDRLRMRLPGRCVLAIEDLRGYRAAFGRLA
jgi:PST family polysaccharide transporter